MINISMISFKIPLDGLSVRFFIQIIIDDTVFLKFPGNSFALTTTLIMKVKMQKL